MDIEYIKQIRERLLSSEHITRDDINNHIQYIPKGKLYRYRPCNENEFNTLRENSIWLSVPSNFNDDFDSILPFDQTEVDVKYYAESLSLEMMYRVLTEMHHEDEILPFRTKEDLRKLVECDIRNVTEKEALKGLRKVGGRKLIDSINKYNEKMARHVISQAKTIDKMLKTLSFAGRHNTSITCFTTRNTNRSMWENYANNYSGFCVGYDFNKKKDSEFVKDILNIYPVEYYFDLPHLKQQDLLEAFVQSVFDGKAVMSKWVDSFFLDYLKGILAKQYDYRAEEEWRYVGLSKDAGYHHFPFATAIYLGKNIQQPHKEQLLSIAAELEIPVFLQVLDYNSADYIFKQIFHGKK